MVAHCDGVDGPVVKAAQAALQSSDVDLVLAWVKKDDEQAVRQAFAKTLEVRKLSPSARELADRYFFETLVRIHRAGEGAPFTGLKPAGRDLGPAIAAADEAIQSGSSNKVEKLLSEVLSDGIRARFKQLMEAKDYGEDDVEAGREYVERYIIWTHYVDGVYQAARERGLPHGGNDHTRPEHHD